MDYSSPAALKIRRLGQRLGVLRPLLRAFRKLKGETYEEAFDAQLIAEIRTGDTVWDIGANVGYYTTKFSESVGSSGRVVAFEPSPAAISRLRDSVTDLNNVTIENLALSEKEGHATFYVSSSGSSVTDGLRRASEADEAHVVEVARGDRFLKDSKPNVIKVDVEGFEREVISGLYDALRWPCLRAIFVEVHFLESVKRGKPDNPKLVCEMLKSAGLSLNWTDPSHVVGRRRT